MRKFKIIIKGKANEFNKGMFSVKVIGDENDIMVTLSQLLIEKSIEHNIPEKEFIKILKEHYKVVKSYEEED